MVDQPEGPYNPLNQTNLALSIAKAILEKKPEPLSAIENRQGSGIYVLYYTGDFDLYQPVSDANRGDRFTWPIYIGKAVPQGARKGLTRDSSTGYELKKRLTEHASSIGVAENLDLADFFYQMLVVEDIWIPLGERVLTEHYKPIWNSQIDGFGNHTPGERRRGTARSAWDALHPGRPWVEALDLGPPKLSPEEVETRLRKHCEQFEPEPLIVPAADDPDDFDLTS